MTSTESDEVLELRYFKPKPRTKKFDGYYPPGSCPVCGATAVIFNKSLKRSTYSCGYASESGMIVSKCCGTDS